MQERTTHRLTNLQRLALSVVAFTSTFAAHAARADAPDTASFDARRQALIALAREFPAQRVPCPVGSDRALDGAILTHPDARDPVLVAKLQTVAGRVLRPA